MKFVHKFVLFYIFVYLMRKQFKWRSQSDIKLFMCQIMYRMQEMRQFNAIEQKKHIEKLWRQTYFLFHQTYNCNYHKYSNSIIEMNFHSGVLTLLCAQLNKTLNVYCNGIHFFEFGFDCICLSSIFTRTIQLNIVFVFAWN